MKPITRMLCLVLVLCLFAAMALGSSSKPSSSTKPIAEDTTKAEEAPAKEETPDQPAETKPAEEETEPEAAKPAGSGAITIEEQVLFEQDGIKVTATEFVHDALWGDEIKVLVENDSAQNVTVSCDALIVNNYMISDLFYCEVAAGKKTYEDLNLSSSGLEAAGISTVGEIEIYFRVYDTDSWDDLFKPDPVTIRTSAYDQMDTTPNDTGKELLNQDGIRIVGKYVDENSFWGAGVLLYMENHSGRNVMIQCEDMSINGFMVTPYFSCTVYDGKMAIDDITLLSSDLEKNHITSVDEVELKFQIIDDDSWDTIFTSDTITFTTK